MQISARTTDTLLDLIEEAKRIAHAAHQEPVNTNRLSALAERAEAAIDQDGADTPEMPEMLHAQAKKYAFPQTLYGLSLAATGGINMYCEDDETLYNLARSINYALYYSSGADQDEPAQVVPVDKRGRELLKETAEDQRIIEIGQQFEYPIFLIQPWGYK